MSRLDLNKVPGHDGWHYGLGVIHGDTGRVTYTLLGPDKVEIEFTWDSRSGVRKHEAAGAAIDRYQGRPS